MAGSLHLTPRSESALRAQAPPCPDCDLLLRPYSCEGALIFKCDKCHGLWLNSKRLGVFRRALNTYNLSQLEIQLHGDAEGAYYVGSCTRCHIVFEEFHYGYNSGVFIYRCPKCHGLWLPLREVVHLLQTVQLGQTLMQDIRGYLREAQHLNRELLDFQKWVRWFRRFVD